MSDYGLKAEVAVQSLGRKPLDYLESMDQPARLEEVLQELRQDENVETVQRPLLEKYFEVLEEEEVVEYDENGQLFNPGNKSLHKNGYADEEIDNFLAKFEEDY